MATGRVPTTANSPLTAKGDLFGYSTTQARVPVGADGETIVADSSTSTGLRYTGNFSAGKNKIINGDFSIWQRGTSFTPAVNTYVYCADRFRVVRDGSGTVTVSQQTFTPGTAPVSGYEGTFFFRYNQTVAGSGGTYSTIEQPIEDVRSFAGQTVTISFWAKADAARTFTPQFIQGFGSGGSTRVDTNGSAITLTTSWTRYTQTLSIPSVSGKTIGTGSSLVFVLNLALNTTQTLDFWGFQVEAGSVATAFQTATGTIQGELAACQRYYYRSYGSTPYNAWGMGIGCSNILVAIYVNLPVTMRTTPTVLDSSTLAVYDTGTVFAITSPTINGGESGQDMVTILGTTSGTTAFRPYKGIFNNSSSAYIGLGAEL
jgi:hypothetical protein